MPLRRTKGAFRRRGLASFAQLGTVLFSLCRSGQVAGGCRMASPDKSVGTLSTVEASSDGFHPDIHPSELSTTLPLGQDDVNLWTTAVDTDADPSLEVHFTMNQDVPESTVNEGSRRSCLFTALELFKYVYSTALLVFCLVIVAAAMFQRQTTATGDFSIPPIAAFLIFWFLLAWLAMMEGGLNCMVGLQPINKAFYTDSHSFTVRCTSLAHRGDNMERFIVGRQFLDLLSVFVTNFMVSAVSDASVLGLSETVSEAFLGSGLAVILVTIVFGQLTTQINAAHSMLDFVNNRVMLAITYLALTVEASGLLHAVYLIQISFAKLTGKPIESHEAPRTNASCAWFWFRVIVSTCMLIVSLVVTMFAIFDGQTTMWEGIPPAVSLVLLVVLILLTGMMEGLQIAFMAVVHWPDHELDKHATAHRNCRLVFAGKNLQTFLIGRQIFQTFVMFFIARIMTVKVSEGDNLLGVSDGLQKFFNTGLLGALFSTILASLAWRVIASTFPLAFLSNPMSSAIIHFCLLVEKSGVCYSAWLTAAVLRRLTGYKLDEDYLAKNTPKYDLELGDQEGEGDSATDESGSA